MNEIAVRIFWGPWGGEIAPKPVVSVGEVVGEFEPSPPSLVKEEEKSWMLKIDNQRTVFSSYSKEPCVNAEGFLQLLVCVFIPTGQRLANGKSPLELLTAVRDQFGLLFSFNLQYTPSNVGKVNGRFGQLIARYPLEKCPWYDFRMEGAEAASFCVDSMEQLNALMLYHAYTPLAHIEHLELGLNCKSTIAINTKGESGETKEEKRKWWQRLKRHQDDTPTPPKRQEKELKPAKDPTPVSQSKPAETTATPVAQNKGYQVWVNGEPQNVFLRWVDDEYVLHQDSTEDYRYESLRVKLGDLKAAPKRKVATLSGRTVAQLDEKNNRINCEMKPVERWLRKEIGFTTDSDVEARKFVKYNPDKVQIMIGREPWTDDKIKPSVAEKAVKKNNIRIAPKEIEGYRFSVASAKIAKDRLVVMIEAKNMAQAQPKVVPPPPTQQKKSYEVVVNGQSQAFLTDSHEVLQVRLPSEDDFHFEPFSFSLHELKRSPQGMIRTPSGQTTIQLDEQKGKVLCKSQAIPHYLERTTISFNYARDFGRDEALASAIRNLRVTVNGNVYPIRPSAVKKAIREKRIGLSASEFGDYSFRVIQSSYDEASRILNVTVKVEKKKKGGLFKWISSLLGIAVFAFLLLALPPAFRKNSSKETKKSFVEISYSFETPKAFPYNTCFVGTIGGKGRLTIDDQGGGYYIYDNSGTDLKRQIKVETYDASSGYLVINSFDTDGDYIGKFVGFAKDSDSYSGAFTNIKGGSVEFSLYVE